MKISILIIYLPLLFAFNTLLTEQSEKDIKTTKVPVFEQIHSDIKGAVSEFVWTVHNDKQGNFWFGTNNDGLVKYDGETLVKYYKLFGVGSAVRDIVEDGNGIVWFGSSSGVLSYNGKKFQKYTVEDGLPSNDIWSLEIGEDDVLWVGSAEGICKFVDGKFVTLELPTSSIKDTRPMISENRVVDMLKLSNGNLFIGMDGNGIWSYNKGKFDQITTKQSLPDNFVSSFLEDDNGNVWIGTYYEGIIKYDGIKFITYKELEKVAAYEIRKIISDSSGNAWFTTESKGVYKYDGKKFTNYTKEDGLVSNNILGIDQDRNGKIWVTTWQGLSIFEDDKFVNASEVYEWLD
jgi:ligand-binding sensor domain-containing protein